MWRRWKRGDSTNPTIDPGAAQTTFNALPT